ncbi:MAG: phosphonate ABC transporter substrate-binding protein [Halothiobacillaceae bacterium]|nr:phosphonate ABC transporter substrate-binding protein [Halothiobacillaceae bacterium]
MNLLKKTLLAALLGAAVLSPIAQADITLGLIPAENTEEMIKKFEPMRVYLEKKLGEKVKVYTATDYTGVIEAMRKKRIDIAWFGPLSYVLAQQEAGAVPFAVGIRKGSDSPTYKSIFVAKCDSGIKTLADLKGRDVAFVNPASTSGGLMPTYMIYKQFGVMPKDFFGKFTYAGSHDAAELAVANGTVAAAADNDITYEKMVKKGQIDPKVNCIIAESTPLPGSPLTYRDDLSPELKKKIRDAILNAHTEIQVSGYGELSHYAPVDAADYQIIRDMIQELKLSKQDLLK